MTAKRQKVDATVRLRLEDPLIHRDAYLLDKVRAAAAKAVTNRPLWNSLKSASPLYIRYRGDGFPLKTRERRIPPPWRSLSPWMRLQVAGLCLAEHTFQQFRITPAPALVTQLASSGKDLKAFLRDDLRRRMRRAFPQEPWFFFAIEDRSVDGTPVAPHVHGSVRVQPLPLPRTQAGDLRVRWARMVEREGIGAAELEYGRHELKRVLRLSAGEASPGHHSWSKEPIARRSNPDWISYALKNMAEPSSALPDRRLVISRTLTQEAHRLWELIRKGEEALAQWR